MECVDCGSAATSERRDRTAQGYRRFRCRDCGREFNERSGGLLNRTACCMDPKLRRTRPNPIRDQAMRTEIGRPSSSMRLSA